MGAQPKYSQKWGKFQNWLITPPIVENAKKRIFSTILWVFWCKKVVSTFCFRSYIIKHWAFWAKVFFLFFCFFYWLFTGPPLTLLSLSTDHLAGCPSLRLISSYKYLLNEELLSMCNVKDLQSPPTWLLGKVSNTTAQIHKYKYTKTNTQKQMHKYKYTNTNTHIHSLLPGHLARCPTTSLAPLDSRRLKISDHPTMFKASGLEPKINSLRIIVVG